MEMGVLTIILFRWWLGLDNFTLQPIQFNWKRKHSLAQLTDQVLEIKGDHQKCAHLFNWTGDRSACIKPCSA